VALLRVQIDEHSHRDYILEKGTTRIGRRADNDVVLDDPSVSNQHARLNHEDAFFLTDLRSSNGTFINGKKILHSKLSDGDVINFAGVHAVFYK
jgi:pSer/pThr/pTyr-binding forkhead associated (FHA) protein